MNAIEALRKAREEQVDDSPAEESQESRQIVLLPDELLALGKQGLSEGSPVSVIVNGTMSGGVVTVDSLQVMGPMKAAPSGPEKAPIVRINPAPYPG